MVAQWPKPAESHNGTLNLRAYCPAIYIYMWSLPRACPWPLTHNYHDRKWWDMHVQRSLLSYRQPYCQEYTDTAPSVRNQDLKEKRKSWGRVRVKKKTTLISQHKFSWMAHEDINTACTTCAMWPVTWYTFSCFFQQQGTVQHFGKCAHLLSFWELDEKTDTTLMFAS